MNSPTNDVITQDRTQDRDKLFLRSVRSFVCRNRALTPRLQSLWEQFWPIYGAESHHTYNDAQSDGIQSYEVQSFMADPREIILEIGFGDGQSLLQMAVNNPDKLFMGVEVYRFGIATLLAEIAALQLKNIRLFMMDAHDALTLYVPKGRLSAVHLFFPDPWPKIRHQKRRIVQEAFNSLVLERLRLKGRFHLATDWEDYALHMMSTISKNPQFHNIAGLNQFSSRPDYRPMTKYERRGQQLGHGTWDLIFERSSL